MKLQDKLRLCTPLGTLNFLTAVQLFKLYDMMIPWIRHSVTRHMGHPRGYKLASILTEGSQGLVLSNEYQAINSDSLYAVESLTGPRLN